MWPQKITIVEVGPRDGLQNEAQFVPTRAKKQFIEDLEAAGLSEIEATSFVHPQWVPQLADAEALLKLLPNRNRYRVLVPNQRGVERALKAGVRKLAFFTAASETFNQKNINTSIAGCFENMQNALKNVDQKAIELRIYVSTAFYCPYEGQVNSDRVLDVVKRALDLNPKEISIGDTIGKANTNDVDSLLHKLLSQYPADLFALHFHDTYHLALANVKQGLQMGITLYDSSAGGLGGCPYAPGAAGNLATEDLVQLCNRLGIDTGVCLDALRAASARLKGHLQKNRKAQSSPQ